MTLLELQGTRCPLPCPSPPRHFGLIKLESVKVVARRTVRPRTRQVAPAWPAISSITPGSPIVVKSGSAVMTDASGRRPHQMKLPETTRPECVTCLMTSFDRAGAGEGRDS